MSKRTEKRIGHAVAALAATILLASCGKDDKHAGRDEGGHAEPVSPPLAGSQQELVERRHFDIYRRYQPLFEQPLDGARARIHDDEERLQHAVMTVRAASLDILRSCSMRAVLAGY
ncbi:MAG TPA: hypothetical protein VEC01_04580 [Noviherbaspirillum sp.]|uniref:hypothetical protein n=1 Tax=Noviherbaspirillum sp. TaxID=1926288 RepID=UPI002D74384D|nr:hypothetical protein [Noviherbaspirillum sp.]HYD94580.1 hypothetical protein [Noviherbaspirillum sp.]